MERLNDILIPKEKKLYKKILADMEKNLQFYSTSSPEEITSYLIDDCGFNRDDIYRLFKKISLVSGE